MVRQWSTLGVYTGVLLAALGCSDEASKIDGAHGGAGSVTAGGSSAGSSTSGAGGNGTGGTSAGAGSGGTSDSGGSASGAGGEDTGAACEPSCAPGDECASHEQCASRLCEDGVCAEPACDDGIENGEETDVDCGGPMCEPCANASRCDVERDCVSGSCVESVCQPPTCSDEISNGDETDLDCGGPCGGCDHGAHCGDDGDCESKICSSGVCAAPTCDDGVTNGGEGDIDCGGDCDPCPNQSACTLGAQCESLVCYAEQCAVPTCEDGVRNGLETDQDCGGVDCEACEPGQHCALPSDCSEGVCEVGACQPPKCTDGVHNGTETDLDCGSSCAACDDGQTCAVGADCQSSSCVELECEPPACDDEIENGQETDLDCGGGCDPCELGKACVADDDCASGYCFVDRCARAFVGLDGPPVFETGVGGIDVGSGDIDGDGLEEIIGMNEGDASIGVLAALGGGRFELVAQLAPPGASIFSNAEVADVNDDGENDLLVLGKSSKPSSNAPSDLSVYLNHGGFDLVLDEEYFMERGAKELNVADLDGDGALDLAYVTYNKLAVQYGDGTGKFADPVYVATWSSGAVHSLPVDVVVDEFVGGGLPDIAVLVGDVSPETWFYRNLGGRAFATPAVNASIRGPLAKAGDVNGDGHADLLGSSGLKPSVFWLGNGNGGMTQGAGFNDAVYRQEVGDVDGDGDLDAVLLGDQQVVVHVNDGHGAFSKREQFYTSIQPYSMTLGHYDLAPGIDLAVTHDGWTPDPFIRSPSWGANVAVYLNEVDHYNTGLLRDAGARAEGIAAADFDGDGDLDLAVSDYAALDTGRVGVFLFDGGLPGARVDYSTDKGPRNLGAGDFDGDGDVDIVSANSAVGTLSLLKNNGNGTFAPQVSISLPQAMDVAVTDFNKNGYDDIVVARWTYGVSYLYGSPSGFGAPTTIEIQGGHTETVVVGDIDGDATREVVTTDYGDEYDTSGCVRIIDGGVVKQLETGWNPSSAAIADFDGDGRTDFAVANSEGFDGVIYRNTGKGYTELTTYYTLIHVSNLQAADFNGDGRADLAVANFSSNAVSVLLSAGAGGMYLGEHYRASTSPNSLALGDFDQNGALDVATASDHALSLLFNLDNP
jgi:hypothetical protein